MSNKLHTGNYVGIGLCIATWFGIIPFIFQQVGLPLEFGILIAAVSLGLLIPILLYFKSKEKTK